MATLASAIATKVQAVIASQTMIDLTNQRDNGGAVTEDTSVTDAAAELAAADVQSELGDDVDGDDTQAVSIGVALTIARISETYTLLGADRSYTTEAQVFSRLRRLAKSRTAEAADPLLVIDSDMYEDLDARWSARPWYDEDLDYDSEE